jgi:hypothetical protein
LFTARERFNADVYKNGSQHWADCWLPAARPLYSPYLNQVDVPIGCVLQEKSQAMSHANLAALSAAIIK